MNVENIEDLSDKENLVTSELAYYIRTNDKIELYTSSRLTPDQRRTLLFNVKQPFEVQEQDFNKEWWPLVTNVWTRYSSRNHNNSNSWVAYACRFTKHNQSSTCSEGVPSEKRRKTKVRSPDLCHAKIRVSRFVKEQKILVEQYPNSLDHTHTIEESEMLKHSQLVRNLVEKEAIKNYPSPAIVNAVKEYATKRLDLSASVKELKRMEVYNIKKKVYGSQNSYLIGNQSLDLDIEESILFLKKEGYQVERYGQSAQGFVFAHPYQLEKLGHFGWLTLIDSTHKTNKYDWRLFTLYVRDNHGSWCVGAHFFVSDETSVMVAEALQIVRRFRSSWMPRYFFADQSNVEEKGIIRAFPGLPKGEQACDILFCTVHVVRTWMHRIYEPKVRGKMIHAMHKITKAGCNELIKEAVDNCQVPDIKRYITRNYTKNTNQWALWSRQHSPLLLQITSMNAVESFHSELKRLTTSYHGLIGACNKVVTLDTKKRSDAESVAFEFRTKQISAFGVDCETLSQIYKFLFPIQQLIVSEIHAVDKRIEKGKETPGLMSPECHCHFFCQYLLPCRHMFHEQLYGENKLLTLSAWKEFQQMFIESGFEVYFNRELVEIDSPKKTEAEKAADKRRLMVNELIERTRNAYWRVEEKGDSAQKVAFIETLTSSLNVVLNPKDKTM